MTPVLRAFSQQPLNVSLLHSGQHFSHDMDDVFFEELGLRAPDHRIQSRTNTTHAQQTAHIMKNSEAYLCETRPSILLVYGDTNSALAGALAARKAGIAVGHIEAGLRSDDWRMPEEHNRVMIDHISDLLFAPTESAAENLREDNVQGEIEVTGNPIVDVIHSILDLLPDDPPTIDGTPLRADEYLLATCHRQENVDDRQTLLSIIGALQEVVDLYDFDIIYPVHPRAKERIQEFDLDLSGLTLINPVGFTDFLHLERDARLILTDSGGVQEEACILGTPCVTIREATERPETVTVGANIVAGTTKSKIIGAVSEMLGTSGDWQQPFGDGTAGEQIAHLAKSFVGRND